MVFSLEAMAMNGLRTKGFWRAARPPSGVSNTVGLPFWGVRPVVFVVLGLMGLGMGQVRFCPVDRTFLKLWPSPISSLRIQDGGDTLWVPVVFHLVASDSSRWLPRERVLDQMVALNRDFLQARVQFYLPAYGPGGLPTCGVTWHVSPWGDQHNWMTEEDSLKALVCWPPDSFVNIWVVEHMTQNVIGYARALTDREGVPGMVLAREVTGNRRGTARPFDWGRTAVHEMGHIFSLLHPFEGGCQGLTPADCHTAGDEICDTPGQRSPAFNCPALGSQNTCTEVPTDLPDPLDNLMSYVDDSCMFVFTPLQIQRMRTYLLVAGAALLSPINQQARGRALNDADCQRLLFLPSAPALRSVLRILPHRIESTLPTYIWLYNGLGRCLREGWTPLSLEGLPVGLYVIQLSDGAVQKFFHMP